jgi:hypothetical protein
MRELDEEDFQDLDQAFKEMLRQLEWHFRDWKTCRHALLWACYDEYLKPWQRRVFKHEDLIVKLAAFGAAITAARDQHHVDAMLAFVDQLHRAKEHNTNDLHLVTLEQLFRGHRLSFVECSLEHERSRAA